MKDSFSFPNDELILRPNKVSERLLEKTRAYCRRISSYCGLLGIVTRTTVTASSYRTIKSMCVDDNVAKIEHLLMKGSIR